MRFKKVCIGCFILIALITIDCSFHHAKGSEFSLSSISEMTLSSAPLDLAASPSDPWIFILVKGEIQIFSTDENKVIKRFPIDISFDQMAYSGKSDSLILSSRTSQKLKIIRIDEIHPITTNDLAFLGNENAKVTIAVFSQYMCPHCARIQPLIDQLLNRYQDKIKIVFKNYPFSDDDNNIAFKASVAAQAARKQNKFFECHHALHAAEKPLTDEKIETIAKELKLDMDQFHKDILNTELKQLIRRDRAEGQMAGITGVPTFMVNNKLVKREGLGLFEMIDLEIEQLPEKSQTNQKGNK